MMLRLVTIAGFLHLLVGLVSALHFPGLISKDYPYNAELPIKSSYYYSAKARSRIFKHLKRWAKKARRSIFDLDAQKAWRTRYAVSEAFDMCHPSHGKEAPVVSGSPIAGYLGYSKQLTSSAYAVPLKLGIPTETDSELGQDGHDKCFTLCEREWSRAEVDLFRELVAQGYGYRLFLDDLPSATKYDNQDHYDENIPLGYLADPMNGKET